MLSINPINFSTINKSKYLTKPVPRTIDNVDTFIRTTKPIAFKGNIGETVKKFDLHFPLGEVEELLKKTYAELEKEPNLDKKVTLTDRFNRQFKEISATHAQATENLDEGRKTFNDDRIHEVKGPLMEFYGNIISRVLMDGNDSGISADAFNNAFKHMSDGMINSIKRFEFLLDKGLDSDAMTPKEVLKLALDSADEKVKSKNLKLEVVGEDALDEFKDGILHTRNDIIQKYGDKIHNYTFYTILANLIRNAAKYTSDNSSVVVKLEKQKINNHAHLAISVEDRGIGIPKEEQEKVLNGNRATNALQSGIEGTGYGLSRVKKILDRYNSTISIESPLDTSSNEFPGSRVSCFIKLKD